MGRPRLPLDRDYSERFWAKVDKSGLPNPALPELGPCWIWTAATDGHGYGQFNLPGRKIAKAHRVAYLLIHGELPNERTLDHLCRVKLCVNPAHLEPCSDRVNILRSTSQSALHARQTHCTNGHPFTPENTYIWQGGRYPKRICRVCSRERKKTPDGRARHAASARRRYARRKAATAGEE